MKNLEQQIEKLQSSLQKFLDSGEYATYRFEAQTEHEEKIEQLKQKLEELK